MATSATKAAEAGSHRLLGPLATFATLPTLTTDVGSVLPADIWPESRSCFSSSSSLRKSAAVWYGSRILPGSGG